MTKKKFISFWQAISRVEEINSVKDVLNSSWLGTGKITQNFEKKFLDYKNQICDIC